jgi:xanthine dehydrogenase small subunit
MRDFVLIHVNGHRHEVRGARVFQSLSDFLRYDLQLTGTKVVCAEGDCGSCSVLLGRAAVGRIAYKTVCSCIQFLYQLDCCHVVTIEGLKYDGKLNPVQDAMVKCQGSQCGFCTPGFVVSLCALFDQQKPVQETDIRNACIGNLCRCTGYEPIIRAAGQVNTAELRQLESLFPSQPLIQELSSSASQEVLVRDGDREFFKPLTLAAASSYRAAHPESMVIAGGTDVGVQINKGLRQPKTILSLSALRELEKIRVENGAIIAGALCSITELERVSRSALPEYSRLLGLFGSPPIRNAGTIGGNIANGSPIGDSMPAMYVLNAVVELAGATHTRQVNINDFYTGYRKTVMQAGELIANVIIPIPSGDEIFKLYKVSRRRDLDISAFTAAIWMKRDGEIVREARIAYGGVGPNIIRLTRTEAFFAGKAITPQVIRAAGSIAREEITPISDVRGSASFRSQLATNILRKFYAQLSEPNGNWSGSNGNGNGSSGHDTDRNRSRNVESQLQNG